MYQLYFLAVALNVISGIVLAFDKEGEGFSISSIFSEGLISHPAFKVSLGLSTFLVGFLKLIWVFEGDTPVFGDFLPALAGLLAGFTLVLSYYSDRSDVGSEMIDKLESVFLQNATIIGLAAMITSGLHFLFAGAILL